MQNAETMQVLEPNICELHVNCSVIKPYNCDSKPMEGKTDALLQEKKKKKSSMENNNDINAVKSQLKIYATYASIKEWMSLIRFL